MSEQTGRPLRVLHLPSVYLPDALGGTQVYVRSLCAGLAARGHQSAVVWHAPGPADSDGEGPETRVWLPAVRVDRRADLTRAGTDREPPGFRELLADWRPDVAHFHAFTVGAGRDHIRVLRTAGVPHVVTYHTPAQSCPSGTLMRWGTTPCDGRIRPFRCAACSLHAGGLPTAVALPLAASPLPWHLPDGPWVPRLARRSLMREWGRGVRGFFASAAAVVATAEFCRDVLVRNGVPADRITVIRQALPGPDRSRPLRLPASAPDRPLRLGMHGRLTPVKGVDLLVAAAERLAASGTAVGVELVGPVEAGDRAWFDRLTRPRLVTHRGVLTGDELTSWLDTLDVAVVPSRGFETGPLTLLEAWDRGVPVVGAAHSGIAEFVAAAGLRDLLFSTGDATELAAAVRRAIDWPGRPPVVRVPGMDDLAARMEQVYAGAVGRSDFTPAAPAFFPTPQATAG